MEFIIDNKTIKGHDSYITIMESIANPKVDVSEDPDFQTAFHGYYIRAKVNKRFKEFYFSYMQQCRSNCPSFEKALTDLYEGTGAVYYSFASKLLHTLDDTKPILDKHIMRLMGFRLVEPESISNDAPDCESKKYRDALKRIKHYVSAFETISAEYDKYRNEPFMSDAINRFDALPNNKFLGVSYVKKVDMLLFRLRNEQSVSVLDYLSAIHRLSE